MSYLVECKVILQVSLVFTVTILVHLEAIVNLSEVLRSQPDTISHSGMC